jgi:aminopeptidase N
MIRFLLFLTFAAVKSQPVVEKYKVEIEPIFESQSVKGSTQIVLKSRTSNNLEFPLYGLTIDKVFADSKITPFNVSKTQLKINLNELKLAAKSIQVKYHGKPDRGIFWGIGYMYSNYDPCGWMICYEEPGIKAPIEIRLTLPSSMKAVANGSLISSSSLITSKRHEVWREDRPYSSYLYGFAIGNFNQASVKIGDVELEYLGYSGKEESLLNKFKDTPRVLQFFEKISGVPIPLKKYTQVLVGNDEAQEKHGFSILGQSYIDPILDNPEEDWAIVHELAHQWWGNLLTCKTWEHFWLNEAVATFMTAAYKQERWGQASYLREMELAKKRYQAALDANFDVPLTFAGTYPSLRIKRAIVYSKGTLFLDALRSDLGEGIFWEGFREYTKKYQLKSVKSQDFQLVMEEVAGRSLSEIFQKWVY